MSLFQNRLLELYFTPSEDQVGVGLLPLPPSLFKDSETQQKNMDFLILGAVCLVVVCMESHFVSKLMFKS